ncbi:Mitotic spindle assembly checkpoint protein MAD2A [Sciurus carolinensis]|uniref:Mitotic spindle assembly checkpoint protein MAD2A n=1 Tax=Sciurus carolinensis TaxID=30640 RepID=A0AA41SZP9_SCICA|nr:Mitotic spindle assembly checkpoint protein MAD2A [Sciurus carolinensis]
MRPWEFPTTEKQLEIMVIQQLFQEQDVTLSRRAEIVGKFFLFCVNKAYIPSETLTPVQKYGLTLLITTDPELIKYLNCVVEVKRLAVRCSVQKLVVVILSVKNREVLEKWLFDIECDLTAKDNSAPREKSQEAIQDESCSVYLTDHGDSDVSTTVGSFLYIRHTFTLSFVFGGMTELLLAELPLY